MNYQFRYLSLTLALAVIAWRFRIKTGILFNWNESLGIGLPLFEFGKQSSGFFRMLFRKVFALADVHLDVEKSDRIIFEEMHQFPRAAADHAGGDGAPVGFVSACYVVNLSINVVGGEVERVVPEDGTLWNRFALEERYDGYAVDGLLSG